ncbi:MAG: hypothetical protein U0Q19_20335 [Kineosporiaceae bacterium]
MTTTDVSPRLCLSCRAELGAKALFCTTCGTAVPREQREKVQASRQVGWWATPAAPTTPAAPAPAPAPEPVKREEPKAAPEPEVDPAPEGEPAPEPVAVVKPVEVEKPVAKPVEAEKPVEKPAPVLRQAPELTTLPEVKPAPDAAPAAVPAPAPASSSPPRSRRRPVVIAALAVGVLAGLALVFWPGAGRLREAATQTDVRQAAVTAWRDGNAAWARGDIAAVCDRYDGIGREGMWATRAICVESEQQGYDSATAQRKQVLRDMSVDAGRVESIDADTVVIWFRDVTAAGVRPEYFTIDDLAVMHRTDSGWRLIGARYRGVVVGHVPPSVSSRAISSTSSSWSTPSSSSSSTPSSSSSAGVSRPTPTPTAS